MKSFFSAMSGSLMDGTLKCGLAIIWQNRENECMKVWKLTILFFSGRTLRNKIHMRGFNLDLELL